ncbi:SDR family oxidoreductase [Pikeienuella piscinae]|uniref:SDR family oxidoreductase n=1 Tax=Pikeienuella piscinae TaxID=2748098 RepID=A0A7L5BV77_9RHOB|nr:SDR family oxidoreductase [Pikeienuella piscinae]QIE54076.1 SDR family oxidoreductase [Pikeienuella piscinae]
MNDGPVLILGAGSDIGRALAHRFAMDGRAIQLAARQPDTLEADRSDIEIRHRISVTLHSYDALATDALEAFVDGLPEPPAIAVSVVGFMGDQAESQIDLGAAARVIRSNFEGPAAIFAILANRMEARGGGALVGVSSVAGDRGRASNYVYGAAKAGFSAFLSGLRNRLARTGVHVMTVKPGFVRTRMTEGMDLPPRLTAEPEEVADRVVRALTKNRNVVYVKPIWRLVMTIICAIPEQVFKKTSI